MKNTFGTSVAITLFGESHGEAIGAVLDGMAPGIPINHDLIRHQMQLRMGISALSTARREPDEVEIISGVKDGVTTGTPITLLIKNANKKSEDYEKTATLLRPGHADFAASCKYHGFADLRGGGHFSGRITAGLVAAGAIAIGALERLGIRIGTHIAACGGIRDRAFENIEQDISYLNRVELAVLSLKKAKKITDAICSAKKAGDSVGGILETAVIGLPTGVGEPWFDTVEGVLSHALFSIPAVKGVEFGDGFALAAMRGSHANDPFTVKDGKIITKTNRAGGILGGITNGMPLLIRTAIKPTPSIYCKQDTVNTEKMEDATIQIKGRHDPAIVHRARVVADSVVALALCDLLALHFGTDYLREK